MRLQRVAKCSSRKCKTTSTDQRPSNHHHHGAFCYRQAMRGCPRRMRCSASWHGLVRLLHFFDLYLLRGITANLGCKVESANATDSQEWRYLHLVGSDFPIVPYFSCRYHAVQLLAGECPSAVLCYVVEPWFMGKSFRIRLRVPMHTSL